MEHVVWSNIRLIRDVGGGIEAICCLEIAVILAEEGGIRKGLKSMEANSRAVVFEKKLVWILLRHRIGVITDLDNLIRESRRITCAVTDSYAGSSSTEPETGT